MNSTIDLRLSKIEGLTWLPWVGDRYLDLNVTDRLLIIGESHYHDNSKESIEKHHSSDFTRKTINEYCIDKEYGTTRIFQNLHRALFRNDKFDTKVFWNLVAYYNFIQRPMGTNKGRPDYNDFYNGWKVFFELIKILQPQTCLFVGTSAANSFLGAIQNTDYTTEGPPKKSDFISNAYAKSATIKNRDGKEIQIIFIRHTSQMFSWSKWNEYLRKAMPDKLTFFENSLRNAQIPICQA